MRFSFVFLMLSLTACSPSVLYTPHKMDVQQGNVVTENMLRKVKPGMTKSQVRFALGTPLISDPFHSERWDYVYGFRKRGELIEHSRLTVIFQDDKLKTVEGTALAPSDTVAGTKTLVPIPVTDLALASDGQHPAQPPALLDLTHVESNLGAVLPAPPPAPPPAADAANPAPDQGQAVEFKQVQVKRPGLAEPDPPDQVQAQPAKKSFGERFMGLFGFGKKGEETQQAKVEEKPKAQPEPPTKPQPEPTTEPQPAAQAKRSFGERFMSLFGFGKKNEETQQVKVEEKPEAQPEPQQEEAEAPTNTVMTEDRAPPPKRSTGERFMRLIGFKEKEGDDPAPPVTTEINTSIPRISSLSFSKVMKQILGLDDDKDKEKQAAAEDIEPGESVNTAPKGSTWQRFKRLIGAGSDEPEPVYTPINQEPQTSQAQKQQTSQVQEQQTSQVGTDTKPAAAKSDVPKP